MVFSFDISTLCWACIAVTAFCAITLSIFYCRKILSVAKHNRRGNSSLADCRVDFPSVSVVVYSNDNPTSLSRLLDSLLSQNYSAPYDVIIVNDGSSEDVKDVFNRLSPHHHNLYITFIPDEAQNLSRRKLAITLGVKASRNKYVLFVDADSSVASPDWLRSMARNFVDSDIVLGYAAFDPADDDATAKRLRSFDTAADAVTYLSAALTSKPYRGHLENFGFNRELFFANKGFTRSLNLHSGADDIFIEDIAEGHDTAVELSDVSRIILGGDSPRAFHRRWKWEHIFTGRYVSRRARYVFAFFSWLLWGGALSSLAAVLTSFPNLVPLIFVSVIALSFWIYAVLSWRKALKALGSRRLLFTIPWFVMVRPFYNFYFRLVERRHRKENFTWVKSRH